MFTRRKRITTFWDKVHKCSHKNLSPDYLGHAYCSTPYCGGGMYETHCLDCGVFISKCDCGVNNGMSGWSNRTWYSKMKRKDC